MHIYFMYKWHMEVKTAWKIVLLRLFGSNSFNWIFIVCSLIKPEKDILMDYRHWTLHLTLLISTVYLSSMTIFIWPFPLQQQNFSCLKLMSALHIVDRRALYQMKWWYSSYTTFSKGFASILYSRILTLFVIYTIYSPTEMGKQNYFLYLDRANW